MGGNCSKEFSTVYTWLQTDARLCFRQKLLVEIETFDPNIRPYSAQSLCVFVSVLETYNSEKERSGTVSRYSQIHPNPSKSQTLLNREKK